MISWDGTNTAENTSCVMSHNTHVTLADKLWLVLSHGSHPSHPHMNFGPCPTQTTSNPEFLTYPLLLLHPITPFWKCWLIPVTSGAIKLSTMSTTPQSTSQSTPMRPKCTPIMLPKGSFRAYSINSGEIFFWIKSAPKQRLRCLHTTSRHSNYFCIKELKSLNNKNWSEGRLW